MGDVVDFARPKQTRELPQSTTARGRKPAPPRISREELLAQGGEAYEELGAWRSKGVPMEDRIEMARNMDAILNELRITANDLPWQEEYRGDREAFNRDLYRMRLPPHVTPGRRLIALSHRWTMLLRMIASACEKKGENIALNGLAERLTRRTRFHPVKQAQSIEDKQLYKLKLWANDIDERAGLLRTFKHLAELRAAYFRRHLRDIADSEVDTYAVHAESLVPETYFESIPESAAPLFSRQLGSYTDEDWESLFLHISEELHWRFESYRNDISEWRANFDPQTTLFRKEGAEPLPIDEWVQGDMRYLPRFFLGWLDYKGLRVLDRYSSNDLSGGSQDPFHAMAGEPDFDGCYLVLYPNPELTRLIPYVMIRHEDQPYCSALEEDHIRKEGICYFPPSTSRSDCVSKSLLARIEEAGTDIQSDWFQSSAALLSHPHFEEENSRQSKVDQELASITGPDRTNQENEGEHPE